MQRLHLLPEGRVNGLSAPLRYRITVSLRGERLGNTVVPMDIPPERGQTDLGVSACVSGRTQSATSVSGH